MPDKIIYITLVSEVDPIKTKKFITQVADIINQHSPTELYFLISSHGGDVDSGFVLYNFLVALQGKVTITMHNVGNIDSIANILFLAGQKRYAAPTATFLFHGVAMNFKAAGYGSNAIKEHLSRLDDMETRIALTMSKATTMLEEEIKVLFHQGESRDVNYALQKQIISEIKAPSIPPDSVHLIMNLD